MTRNKNRPGERVSGRSRKAIDENSLSRSEDDSDLTSYNQSLPQENVYSGDSDSGQGLGSQDVPAGAWEPESSIYQQHVLSDDNDRISSEQRNYHQRQSSGLREMREPRDRRDSRDPRDSRDTRDRDSREGGDSRDMGDRRDSRESGDRRDSRDGRDSRYSRPQQRQGRPYRSNNSGYANNYRDAQGPREPGLLSGHADLQEVQEGSVEVDGPKRSLSMQELKDMSITALIDYAQKFNIANVTSLKKQEII